MFGDEFFKNAIICFSKFGYDKKSIKDREKRNKSEKKMILEFQSKFKETYEVQLQDT
jgi:hypothetical protein